MIEDQDDMQGEQGVQGEQGHDGIQGDRGRQGHDGNRGVQGERGIQGQQGVRGERGADSDSIEVLTEVLDGLRNELRGLRSDVQKERHGRRLSLTVLAVAFVLTTLTVGAGWANYLATTDRDRNRAQAAQVESVRRTYDLQASLHATCLRRDELRTGVRALFSNLYDQLQSFPPAVPRTPTQQADVDMFLVKARQDVVTEIPRVDCDAEAPAPAGKRP
jgi:hypothetical protein